MPALNYHESPPAAAAAPLVACHWAFAADRDTRASHDIIPDGCVSIAWRTDRGGAPVVVGPRLSSFTIQLTGGERYFGVRLWPFAARAVLGVEPGALRETVQPLAQVEPALAGRFDAGKPLADQCDVIFAEIAADRGHLVDPAVRGAVALIMAAGGDLRIAAVPPQLMLSARQLERRFALACGITMKQFARIRRFRTAAAGLLAGAASSHSHTAAASGYADEAHLIRECAALAGVPPRMLLARLAEIRHGPLHY